MKKSYFTVVLTLACLLGLGVSSRAQDAGRVVVNVPFAFVAGGQTLPAGKYTISRASAEVNQTLLIRGYDKGVVVLPIVFDGAFTGDAKLNFEHIGDKYFLSEVKTPGGAYTVALPRAMVALAQTKDQGTVSSSGTN